MSQVANNVRCDDRLQLRYGAGSLVEVYPQANEELKFTNVVHTPMLEVGNLGLTKLKLAYDFGGPPEMGECVMFASSNSGGLVFPTWGTPSGGWTGAALDHVAIGENTSMHATSHTIGTIVIGKGAGNEANGSKINIGHNSKSTNVNASTPAVTIGFASVNAYAYSIAIGGQSVAGWNETCIGAHTNHASSEGGVAGIKLGYKATAVGSNQTWSTAIGQFAKTNDASCVVINNDSNPGTVYNPSAGAYTVCVRNIRNINGLKPNLAHNSTTKEVTQTSSGYMIGRGIRQIGDTANNLDMDIGGSNKWVYWSSIENSGGISTSDNRVFTFAADVVVRVCVCFVMESISTSDARQIWLSIRDNSAGQHRLATLSHLLALNGTRVQCSFNRIYQFYASASYEFRVWNARHNVAHRVIPEECHFSLEVIRAV